LDKIDLFGLGREVGCTMAEKKQKTKFDKILLDECMQRDGATLIGDYSGYIDNRTKIIYNCKCSAIYSKKFSSIVYCGGPVCDKCSTLNKIRKTKQSNLEKYGVENVFQSKEIKDKQQKTIKEKYGVDNISQINTIKDKKKNTMLEHFGVENPGQSEVIKQKIKATNLERYGFENQFQNEDIKNKIKTTNLERYGVENPSHSPIVVEKIKQVWNDKYGCHPQNIESIQEKGRQTSLLKYGVTHPQKNKEIKNKGKATCLLKYGVENPTLNPDIFDKAQKNMKKRKEYTLPSGEIIYLQGYEPFAMDNLLNLYTETEIISGAKNVPKIKYIINEKPHIYYPDFFIPKDNKIIEVKSTWTINLYSDIIQSKAEATKAQGYIYEFWCFDRKGNRVEV